MTGVQTCALPIYSCGFLQEWEGTVKYWLYDWRMMLLVCLMWDLPIVWGIKRGKWIMGLMWFLVVD